MASTVAISVHLLRVNQRLEFPVHSCDGVLLLAAGLTLTEAFRKKLIERGIEQVMLDEVDAARLVPPRDIPLDDDPHLRSLETALNVRIDDFLRKHGTVVTPCGPAAASQMTRHGARDYSREQQQLTESTQQRNLAAADAMMNDASKGRPVKRDIVDKGTQSSLQLLLSDFGCTLDTTLRSAGQQWLATHAIKMATLGMAMAIEMGFDYETVRTVGITGMVADLGMAGVPAHILNAPRRLTATEAVEVQKHCIRTANMLEKMDWLPGIVIIAAYQVHENPDGTGYPRGLTTKSIHPIARILHTADAYVAMTSDRPDRPRMMGYAAMETLLRQTQTRKHDAEVVKALLRCLSLCPLGSFVALSDQSIGYVIRANGDQFARPVVRRLVDASGQRVDPDGADSVVDLLRSDLTIKHALRQPKSGESESDGRRPVDQMLAS